MAARSAPVRVAIALLLTVGLTLGGCNRARPPSLPPADGGPEDGGPPPDQDTDGDGLCDFDEEQRRTDPLSGDTDVDGFSDYAEALAGSDPFLSDSPNRELLVFLTEDRDAYVDVPVAFSVRGIGETYLGQYVPQPLSIEDDGTTAATFYAGGRSAGASPMENVRGSTEDERFRGVFGRTLLAFSLHFVQRQDPRGCMRAFPFSYSLKRDDGTYAGSVTRWLVVTPPGMTPGATGAVWCGPSSGTCH